jgi:hypothetical protein
MNGEFIFRDVKTYQKAPAGKKYMMVVGIVEVDKTYGPLDEHVYPVKEWVVQPGQQELPASLDPLDARDLIEEYKWQVPGQHVSVENTRGSDFTRVADRALKIVSKTAERKSSKAERAQLLDQLAIHRGFIPFADSMGMIVDQIIIQLRGLVKEDSK